ncbi:MAG TPA: transcription termination factor NusA [Polyangia bacterium]|jgi:N utilization substance protein A|nr:transcription termination factor NusA [Polyangia bacterium]
MNEGAALSLVLDQVSKDKNIDRQVLVETLEQAILTAAKKAFGMHREMEAKFNEETGRVDLFQIIIIADPLTPGGEGKEILLGDAQRFGLKTEVGDELLFQIFYDEKDQARAEEQDAKYGELLKLNRAWKGFGRIAAQTAKQVILQRVREAERENVFNQYKERKGELISGIVRRFERGNIVVDLGGAEAVLPVRDQVPRESYRAGDRIVAYVVDIDKAARGPQIILSRTHKGLLEKLFEMEVPEIYEKIVRIEASAREAGARSKIAVSSRDRDVDPVGACVGMKGSRVQAVVQELRGEKIDIVPYDADPARFVCNAIAPAEVARVIIDAGSHTMELIVPDDKLSLAIGKKGQNVRLASQLTGWRIDIHSETKVREMEQRSRVSMAAIEGVGTEMADSLFKMGWRSAQDVANAKPEELASVPGLGGVEAAKKIIPAAARAADTERKHHAEEMARVASEAAAAESEAEAARASAAAGAAAGAGAGTPEAP